MSHTHRIRPHLSHLDILGAFPAEPFTDDGTKDPKQLASFLLLEMQSMVHEDLESANLRLQGILQHQALQVVLMNTMIGHFEGMVDLLTEIRDGGATLNSSVATLLSKFEGVLSDDEESVKVKPGVGP